jgi:hypothetical protein
MAILCEDASGNQSNTLNIGSFTVAPPHGRGGSIVSTSIIPEEESLALNSAEASPIEETTPSVVTPVNTIEETTPSVVTPVNTIEEVSCHAEPYLTKPIKLGAKNNPEDVKLLEKFLNTYEYANLPVDGIYSKSDFNAVVKWQEKYTDDILKPWGIKKGTGYIFTMSLKKIKELQEKTCVHTVSKNT